jgi:DNA-binding SARP family transcriptional activator/tetratricopeptide (TPR) repeat protein
LDGVLARVRVLGPVVVEGPEGPVDLGPRRRREVLASLAVDAGLVVPFEVVLNRVWGDAGASVTTLHALVSRLRRSLLALGGTPLLLTEASGYRLDTTACRVDALELVDAVAAARRSLAAGRLEDARGTASAALDLWRGRPYLDVRGDFAAHEVSRLEEQRLACLELLVEAELGLGRHQHVLDTLPALAAEHPLRESLQGALVLALYRAGRQADALAVYDDLRRALAEELGIDPGADLQRLWHQVLHQDPDLDLQGTLVRTATPVPSAPPQPDVAPGPAQGRAPGGAPPVAVTVVRAAAPLVGRAAERAALADLVASDVAGHPGFALVRGEAGIGKSHLVDTVADEAAASATVVVGTCWESDGSDALWPWEQVLVQAVEARGLEAVREAAGEDSALLGALLPALASPSYGAVSGPADRARVRLYSAVARVLSRLGEHRPLLVVLEDLHWADAGTLDLLAYLANTTSSQRPDRPAAAARLCYLATARPGSAADELEAMVARAGGLVLALEGLGVEDVGRLVSHHLGDRVATGTAEALRARTEGNPFFLVELTRLLGQERQAEGRADLPVPRSVTAVIESRLRRTAPDDRDVLSAAAVVGRDFDLPLVATVLGRPFTTVADAVDRAVASGLLVEGATPGQQRFSHALVHEVLEGSVGPVRRSTWHAQVAETLVARYGDASPAHVHRIAHHYLSAGVVGDPVEAIRWAQVAAAGSTRRLALGEAERMLTAALELTATLPSAAGEPLETEVRLQLAALLARAAGFDDPRAVEHRNRAASLAARRGATDQVVTSLWTVFGGAYAAGDLDAAELAGSTLSDLVGTGATWAEVAVGSALGQLRFLQGRFAEARGHLAAGIHAAGGLPDPPMEQFPVEPVAVMRAFLALTDTLLGDPGADEAATAAEAAAARADHPFTTAYVEMLLAWRGIWLGRPKIASARAGRALRLAEDSGFVQLTSFARAPAAWAAARAGRLEEAERLARDVAAFRVDGARGVFSTAAAAVLGDVLTAAGRPDEALAVLDGAIAEAVESGELFTLGWLHGLRGAAYDVLGRSEDAARARDEAGLAAGRFLLA